MANESSAQNRHAYPKYKVFIFGVEVTTDVIAINVNYHDGDSPNTCQITMLNEFDKYILTTNDIIALRSIKATRLNIPWITSKTDAVSNTSSAQTNSSSIGSDAFKNAVLKNIFPEEKQKILLAKNNVIQSYPLDNRVGPDNQPIKNSNLQNYFGASIRTYPLQDGASIFHSMDPVRVFMRDPFDPKRWYHHFTGFISDIVDNTDENNTKTLTLIVEDPTKIFRYTRVFINPGVLDAKSVIAENDLRVQTFLAHFMSGFNLAEIFFTLMFGPDRVGAQKFQQNVEGQQASTAISTKLRGIGHFSFDTSDIFLIGPEANTQVPTGQTVSTDAANQNNVVPPATDLLNIKPGVKIDKLQTWQSIIDHEVQLADLYVMATDDDRNNNQSDVEQRIKDIPLLVDGSADIEQVCNRIGTRPDQYLIDGGRLLILIPNSLGASNRDILVKDPIQAYPLNSEWNSASQIMYEVIQRIQFSMYSSPRGDIIIEPPLFDFDPTEFGMTAISSSQFVSSLPVTAVSNKDKAVKIIVDGENFATNHQNNNLSGIRGPFGTKYVVLKKDTYRWESAIVDDKVHTMAVTSASLFKDFESLPNTDIIGHNIVYKIPDLIPLYGTRVIPLTPRGYINSDEGANLFAQIALNKLNADAHTMKIDHVPNIQLWLNRPVYIEGRNLIGTTKQISQSITWGEKGDMSTTEDLYAIRTWTGDMDENDPTKPIYTPLGSGYGAHGFINYAMLFKSAPVPNKTGDNQSETNVDTSQNLNSKPVLGPASDDINAARNTVTSIFTIPGL